jgi:hypothetical protein
MEWQPIETYDKLKKKPALAVFWFAGTPPSRGGRGEYCLSPCAQLSRSMGSRVCTHWMPLPAPPSND